MSSAQREQALQAASPEIKLWTDPMRERITNVGTERT